MAEIKRALTLKEAEKVYSALSEAMLFASYVHGLVDCEVVTMPAFKARRLLELLDKADAKLAPAREILLKTVYHPSEE